MQKLFSKYLHSNSYVELLSGDTISKISTKCNNMLMLEQILPLGLAGEIVYCYTALSNSHQISSPMFVLATCLAHGNMYHDLVAGL